MSANPQREHWTVAEYLALEQQSDHKHEFIDGEVRAMVGASRAHVVITGSIYAHLYMHLTNRPCDLYQSDMRVQLHAEKGYVYPDVTVVCDAPQFVEGQFDTLVNPSVIFEVLSPSTEAYDRGEKFRLYRELSSLGAYVLVSQSAPYVELYTWQGAANWLYRAYMGLTATLPLAAINCTLPLTDIYEKVNFDIPPENETDDA